MLPLFCMKLYYFLYNTQILFRFTKRRKFYFNEAIRRNASVINISFDQLHGNAMPPTISRLL